jgi:hypothetical protein
MRIEQHIVAGWARQLSDKLIKDSIAALEQMDANEMLSGDDSGLKNVWEEICVQVQHEESIFWDAYVETMEGLLAGFVEVLDTDARMALWVVTDEGSDYVDDHNADDDGVRDVPVSEDEIVSKLKNGLLSAAANYSNSRITMFLSRHEDGYDELEEDEDDEDLDDDGAEEQAETTRRFFDLRPAVTDPVVFVITRQQIDDMDVESSLDFLRSLVPIEHPEHAWAYKGRLSLMISGFDSDPRELYEISEVCHYLRALDAEWPFWLFFFNQVDESIKVVAMCLASTIEIAPGAADIDSEGLKHFLERGFSAVNYLFDTYGFPESENEVLSMGVTQILENSMIDPDRDGYSLG